MAEGGRQDARRKQRGAAGAGTQAGALQPPHGAARAHTSPQNAPRANGSSAGWQGIKGERGQQGGRGSRSRERAKGGRAAGERAKGERANGTASRPNERPRDTARTRASGRTRYPLVLRSLFARSPLGAAGPPLDAGTTARRPAHQSKARSPAVTAIITSSSSSRAQRPTHTMTAISRAMRAQRNQNFIISSSAL